MDKAKAYDLGAGATGNGVMIWDRSQLQDGDYKNVAHINEAGEVTILDESLPAELVEKIHAMGGEL